MSERETHTSHGAEQFPNWTEVRTGCAAFAEMKVNYLGEPHTVKEFVENFWGPKKHGVKLLDERGNEQVVSYGSCPLP